MKKNSVLQNGDKIIRILEIKDEKLFIMDCSRLTVPKWADETEVDGGTEITESEFQNLTHVLLPDMDSLDKKSTSIMNERFTVIAEILPCVTDFRSRNQMMQQAANDYGISKQTVKNYLCLYLAYQTKAVLAPKPCLSDSTLNQDEKNMRWALNKYFYSLEKNSLRTAYPR